MKDPISVRDSRYSGSRFASLAPEALLQSRKGGTKHSHHQTSCQNVFQVCSVGEKRFLVFACALPAGRSKQERKLAEIQQELEFDTNVMDCRIFLTC